MASDYENSLPARTRRGDGTCFFGACNVGPLTNHCHGRLKARGIRPTLPHPCPPPPPCPSPPLSFPPTCPSQGGVGDRHLVNPKRAKPPPKGAIQSIPVESGEHVQEFKVKWSRTKKFYT